MMRASVEESEEQIMARFMNGLNFPIKRIVEFQPDTYLVELVHQATKAERQVVDDIKYDNTKAYFAAKPTTSTQPAQPQAPQANSRSTARP